MRSCAGRPQPFQREGRPRANLFGRPHVKRAELGVRRATPAPWSRAASLRRHAWHRGPAPRRFVATPGTVVPRRVASSPRLAPWSTSRRSRAASLARRIPAHATRDRGPCSWARSFTHTSNTLQVVVWRRVWRGSSRKRGRRRWRRRWQWLSRRG
jgi:hypothetical protein